MAKKTAEVEVKLTGAQEAAQQLKDLSERVAQLEERLKSAKKPAKEAGDAFEEGPKKAGALWKKFGDTVADATSGFIKDVSRAANVANAITFTGAIEGARNYQATLGRLSAYTGRSVGELKQQFDDIGRSRLMTREQTTAVFSALARITNDAGFAGKAIGTLADEAIATGRSAEEMVPLGATLHNVFGISGDVTDQLGLIRAQAEQIGTVGGPAVLYDQLNSLSGVLSTVSLASDKSRTAVTGLLAAFQGKSNDPHRGERMLAQATGAIQSQPALVARFLGRSVQSLYDPEGKLNVGEILPEVQKRFFKQYGRGDRAFERALVTFGPELANQLFKSDFSQYPQPAQPSRAGVNKALDFEQSAAAQRERARISAQNTAQDTAEGYLPALDLFNSFAGKHPFAASAATGIGGALLGAGAGGLIRGGTKVLFRSLFGGGAAAAEGGAAEAAAGGGALATGGATAAGGFSSLVAGALGGASAVALPLLGLKYAFDQVDGRGAGAGGNLPDLSSPDAESAKYLGLDAARKGGRIRHGGMQVYAPGAAPSFQDALGYLPPLDVPFGPEGAPTHAPGDRGLPQSPAEQMAAVLAQALSRTNINITVVNQTGGPVQAVSDRQSTRQ